MPPKPAVQFCVRDGCYEVAIGGHQSTPNNLCRPHWQEAVKPDVVECEVVGDATIVSYDDIDVTKGGTVELHPGETHIAQLVYAGFVKVKAPAAAKPKGETKDKKVL
jgi:hypothetical protein